MEKLPIENAHLEYKKASSSVPRDCWETVSAFANTDGGVIILGVTETNEQTFMLRKILRLSYVPLQKMITRVQFNGKTTAFHVVVAGSIPVTRFEPYVLCQISKRNIHKYINFLAHWEDIVRVLNPSISTGLKMEVNIMALDREIINANGTQVEVFRNNDLNAELIKNNISEFERTHMSKNMAKDHMKILLRNRASMRQPRTLKDRKSPKGLIKSRI